VTVDEFLPALRRALREWGQTPDGQFEWENSGKDFNVGDLSNAPYESSPLGEILARHNIHGLEIDVYSCDFTLPWSYDTHLMPSVEEES
jgi:hypothetical protein